MFTRKDVYRIVGGLVALGAILTVIVIALITLPAIFIK